MNTKQMIAIVAVIAVALAGIGAAYAYSATLQNTSNVAPAQYLAISVDGTPTAGDYEATFSLNDMNWDTLTYWSGTQQAIQYKPEKAITDADVSSLTEECYALKVGNGLSIQIDSRNMGADDFYKFTVDTQREINGIMVSQGLNSAEADQQIYKVVYTIDGIPSVVNMNEASEVLFYSDMHKVIDVRIDLYAVQTTSKTLIEKDDLSYEKATFTFKAQVESPGTKIIPDEAKYAQATVTMPAHPSSTVMKGANVAFFIADVQGSEIGYYLDDTSETLAATEAVIKLPYDSTSMSGENPYTMRAYLLKAAEANPDQIPVVGQTAWADLDTGNKQFTASVEAGTVDALAIDLPTGDTKEVRSGFAPMKIVTGTTPETVKYAVFVDATGTDKVLSLKDLLLKATYKGTGTDTAIDYLVTADVDGSTLKISQDNTKTGQSWVTWTESKYTLESGKIYDKLSFEFAEKKTDMFDIITLDLTGDTTSVVVGQQITFTLPADAEDYMLKVNSKDSSIASVSVSDTTVTVTGVFVGDTQIVLTAPDGTQIVKNITVTTS